MFVKAFKQYVVRHWENIKGLHGIIDEMFVAYVSGLIAAIFNLLIAIFFEVHFNLWPVTITTLLVVITGPWLRMCLPAIWYGLTFSLGNFEVIDRWYGYRAFRVTMLQQEYHALYFEKRPYKQEKIIASAIIDQAGTIWCVLKPGRHHHCIAYMAQHGANKQSNPQGFLTDRYRFIGREPARLLAMSNGQCLTPDHSCELFSEDLWDTPEHLQWKG